MKKITILTSFLICIFYIFSQENNSSDFDRHIISLRLGYSIPISTSQIGSPKQEVGRTFFTNTDGEISEKNSFGSRGTGFNASLSYAYMITENISAELDFSFLMTSPEVDAYKLELDNKLDTIYFGSQVSNTLMVRASPMIGIYANKGLLIRPYAKFGLLIPFVGTTYSELIIIDKTSGSFDNLMPIIDVDNYFETNNFIKSTGFDVAVPTYTKITAESSGAFSLGFDARVGAQYNIMEHMNLFVEMNVQMLNVATSKTVITDFYSTVNDETLKALAEKSTNFDIQTEFYLEDIPEILKTTNYIEEITEKSNTSYDKAQVDELLKKKSYYTYLALKDKPLEYLNFKNNSNAFGFLIGFKYGF